MQRKWLVMWLIASYCFFDFHPRVQLSSFLFWSEEQMWFYPLKKFVAEVCTVCVRWLFSVSQKYQFGSGSGDWLSLQWRRLKLFQNFHFHFGFWTVYLIRKVVNASISWSFWSCLSVAPQCLTEIRADVWQACRIWHFVFSVKLNLYLTAGERLLVNKVKF